MHREGFYTALGTPLDASGRVVPESLERQIEQQVENGASGALLLGSMGMQPGVLASEAARAAACAARAVAGRMALFVGVMDNSILGVAERVRALKGLAVDGVVVTAPFYFALTDSLLTGFFERIADDSPFPVYLYDLPGVVKHKITWPMLKRLAAHKNIAGIKTADLLMIQQIQLTGDIRPDFIPLYSGLDTMDVGCQCGVRRYLDGMFACTPKTANRMHLADAAGDFRQTARELAKIVALRDLFLGENVFSGFTVAMNALGCEGSFAPDYTPPASAAQAEKITAMMREMGEI